MIATDLSSSGSPSRTGHAADPSPAPVPVRRSRDGVSVIILDQTALPEREEERELRTVEEVEEAIRMLRVRGAPLIGITAALGVAERSTPRSWPTSSRPRRAASTTRTGRCADGTVPSPCR